MSFPWEWVTSQFEEIILDEFGALESVEPMPEKFDPSTIITPTAFGDMRLREKERRMLAHFTAHLKYLGKKFCGHGLRKNAAGQCDHRTHSATAPMHGPPFKRPRVRFMRTKAVQEMVDG
jgi:hypothetical protein